MAASAPQDSEREYSKIILTLDNVLLSKERLESTPSMQDGLDMETEDDLRILGCELINAAGILLKLPSTAMATGQVIFHRFFHAKSFVKHNYEHVAMACIALASKIEEEPRRIRDVVNVFHYIKQVADGVKSVQPIVLDQNYVNLKNSVIKAERRILKELGFCVHVKHPHKMIVTYLQVLDCEKNTRLVQRSWNYVNDSLRTSAFCQYTPETVACACIYLAARELKIPLPNNPHWFLVFGVNESDIRTICRKILKLYLRPKMSYRELEAKVNEVKDRLNVERMKNKQSTGQQDATGDENTVSASQPGSPANEVKKAKTEQTSDHSGKENHVSRKRRSQTQSSSDGGGSPSNKHRRSPPKSYKKEPHRSRTRSPPRDDKRRHRREDSGKYRRRSRSREKYKRSRSRSGERKKHRHHRHHNGHRRSSSVEYRRI